MNRRRFLSHGLGACGVALATRADIWSAEQRQLHRLPAGEHHYQKVKSYVEEVPVPEYHWASERACENFRDIKYGIRIHWGIYSAAGFDKESWPFLQLSREDKQKYQQIYKTWNPKDFDADAWTNLFVESGLKMFAFTSKHHEGFSMFDTKTRVRRRVNYMAPGGPKIEACDLAYSIMETPFRRDVIKELCDAAHKRGIKIDFYFSHPDWYDADFRPYAMHPLQVPSSAKLIPDFEAERKRLGEYMEMAPDPTPEEVKRMMARHRDQLIELLTNYGTIDMLCLDQWLGPAVWPQLRDTVLLLRKIQPDVMLRARGIGNYGDYYTPEGFVPGAKENTDVPWFVIYPLGRGFSYDPKGENYKGADWIVRNLVDVVAKGGNFMVGVGPDGSGKFHPTAVAQLREAGAWLKVNGEGIYGTRPRDGQFWHEGEQVRFTRTRDGKSIYAFALQWPGESLTLTTLKARPRSVIRMLGSNTPLQWRNDGDRGLVIAMPPALHDESRRPGRFVYGFKINAG